MNSGFTYSIAVTPGLYNGLRITAPRCLARNIPGLRRLLGATTVDFSLTLGDCEQTEATRCERHRRALRPSAQWRFSWR